MGLNDQVLKILTEEMGPSAPMFLERQCKHHLKIEVGALTSANMEELAKWVQIGAKLTIGEDIADKLKSQILSLK